MRRLVLFLALLAFAAAPALAADTAAPDAQTGDKTKDKAPEHKITQSDSYIMVDPIYTTIVDDNRAVGLLMVGVGLDVPNPGLRADVNRSMPVLRDAYVRNLMAFTTTNVRTDAQPDVTLIAQRLQAVTDRALKRKGARILLAQVALRVK